MAMASLSNDSVRDLFSASTGKIEPLPESASKEGQDEERSLQDEKEWLEVMTEKADREKGQPEVQFAVGQYHFSREEYDKALKYFEKAAKVTSGEEEKGSGADKNASSQAKYQLGVMYYDGLGVKENPERGSLFMRQVAESKMKKDAHIIPSAQYNLGRAYFMGFGVPQSDSEAEKWWNSAASLGTDPSSIRAEHTLALYYSRKESLDVHKSYRWHLKAAQNGNLESMAVVGVMLVQGQSCDVNPEEGLSWLKKSAQGGCVYGEGLLSRRYLAMKLYSKAAQTALRASEIEHPTTSSSHSDVGTPPSTIALSKWDCMGVATACFVFARCMQLGNAVLKNEVKAIAYYTKAKEFDKNVAADMHNQLIHDQL